jgi:hypothetical protein
MFKAFPKIPRLNKPVVVTEKIDGTNGCVIVTEDGQVLAQSRNRLITPEQDNYGFAKWVYENELELASGLGPGYHYGEWWGKGIQRGYNMDKRVFSLFNVGRWNEDNVPSCCSVVPTLMDSSSFLHLDYDWILRHLLETGSKASPGFMDPEGIVVYHMAANQYYKYTIRDQQGKWNS